MPRTAQPESGVRRWAGLAVFLLASFVAGGVGSLAQRVSGDASIVYATLDLPWWAPPAATFGIVWPVLYVVVAVAGWRVWWSAGGVRRARAALTLWAVGLLVNAAWPMVFFGMGMEGASIAVIVILDVIVLTTVVAFDDHDRIAAALLVPYLLWILHATALNVAVWWLN